MGYRVQPLLPGTIPVPAAGSRGASNREIAAGFRPVAQMPHHFWHRTPGRLARYRYQRRGNARPVNGAENHSGSCPGPSSHFGDIKKRSVTVSRRSRLPQLIRPERGHPGTVGDATAKALGRFSQNLFCFDMNRFRVGA